MTIYELIVQAIPLIIRHWEENLELAKVGKLEKKHIEYPECVLCQHFLHMDTDTEPKRCFRTKGMFSTLCPLAEFGFDLICCSEWRAVHRTLKILFKSSSRKKVDTELIEKNKHQLIQAVEGMLERVRRIADEYPSN